MKNKKTTQTTSQSTKPIFIEIPADRLSRDMAFWVRAGERLSRAGLMKKGSSFPTLFIRVS